MNNKELTIEELAKQGGMSLRTLRYYMQEGLVPGPDTAGKNASYSQRHVDHVKMIQRLKGLHLPLKEIKQLMANMTSGDLRQLLSMQDMAAGIMMPLKLRDQTDKVVSEQSSALEYIQALELRQNRIRSMGTPPMQPHRNPRIAGTDSQHWTRIVISEGVELQFLEGAGGVSRRDMEEIVREARKILANR